MIKYHFEMTDIDFVCIHGNTLINTNILYDKTILRAII